MKFRCLLLLCGSTLAAADLSSVKTVYVFPMTHGMDQYVANRLTEGHVLQVVSDPKLADAVFTDQLGAAFEYRLAHINPPVDAPKQVKSDKDKNDTTSTDKTDKEAGDVAKSRTNEEPPRVSSFGRGKGTYFLVDAKSKRVLWSAFEKPGSVTPPHLKKTAGKLASKLQDDLSAK